MSNLIDYYLQQSEESKFPELTLRNLKLSEQPIMFSFVWVTCLDLGDNDLCTVDKSYFPPNLEKLCLHNNFVRQLNATDLPESIKTLYLSNNLMEEFDGSSLLNLNRLYLDNNRIKYFKFPPNIKNLNIANNEIEELDDFPESMHIVDCSNNKLVILGQINSGLKKIDFSDNELFEFPNFLDDSIAIFIRGNRTKIRVIDYLPYGLTHLIMSYCGITTIKCHLPVGLRELDLSNNMLPEMPVLPYGIKHIDLSYNVIDKLGYIPESVKKLDVSNNRITEILNSLMLRDFEFNYKNNFVEFSDSEEIPDYWSSFTNRGSYDSGDEYSLSNYDRSPREMYEDRKHYYEFGKWRNQTSSYSPPHVSLKSNSKMNAANPNYVSYGNTKKIVV